MCFGFPKSDTYYYEEKVRPVRTYNSGHHHHGHHHHHHGHSHSHGHHHHHHHSSSHSSYSPRSSYTTVNSYRRSSPHVVYEKRSVTEY